MRVAIFSSHARRAFAAALAWQLTQDGHEVAAIVLKRRPRWREASVERARGVGRSLAQWLARGVGRAADDASLATYAHAHGVPTALPLLARRIGARLVRCESFSAPPVLDALRAQDVALGFHTGDGPLRSPVLELCGQGAVRCHVGALPQLRGSDGVAWSVLLGHPLELTCQAIASGATLLRCPVPLSVGDTLEKLRARVEPLRVEALRDVAQALQGGGLREETGGEAGREYYPMHPRLQQIAAARLGTR